MDVSRRTFIKTTLIGGAGVSVFGFKLAPVYAQTQGLKIERTTETRSTCPYCSVSCGVIIHTLGDKAKNAVPQRINIFRRDGGSVVIPVNLEKVRANESDDIVLRPNDIIDVPFKGRPARRLPPVFETEAESSERRAKLPVTVIE
jgi:anaerobic selenocysteine-containing dehydrogenase